MTVNVKKPTGSAETMAAVIQLAHQALINYSPARADSRSWAVFVLPSGIKTSGAGRAVVPRRPDEPSRMTRREAGYC